MILKISQHNYHKIMAAILKIGRYFDNILFFEKKFVVEKITSQQLQIEMRRPLRNDFLIDRNSDGDNERCFHPCQKD